MLTIALLIAFGFPCVAPIFAATPDLEANLPACCRRHGKHHCPMPESAPGGSSSPVFQGPPCPFCPAAAQQSRVAAAALAEPLWPFIQIAHDSAPLISSQRGAQIAAASAHFKRGPPSRFA
jgi:hypothetical protein